MRNGTEILIDKESKKILVENTIRKYSDMIYRLAFQYTGNVSDAQDVLQEVGVSLITANPPFDDEAYLRNWLCKVTVNKCRNLRKYSKLHACLELDETVACEYDESISLREELAKLPHKYRNVLYLYYYEEFSIKEISKILGLSSHTVGSQLRRGREKLKKILIEGE